MSLTWELPSVSVRWRPPLAVAIVTHLVTRLRVGFGLTIWMQTTSAVLLAVEWCSLARVRMAAQDSRSAHGLLYLAAVWDDGPEQEHGQGRIDSLDLPQAARTCSRSLP